MPRANRLSVHGGDRHAVWRRRARPTAVEKRKRISCGSFWWRRTCGDLCKRTKEKDRKNPGFWVNVAAQESRGRSRKNRVGQLLTEARREFVRDGALLEGGVFGMEPHRAVEEFFFNLDVFRVRQATLHGAHRLAGLVVVKPDALRAQLGVDKVDFFALADCLVGAFGLASAAIDAVGRDVRGHGDAASTGFEKGRFLKGEGEESSVGFLQRRATFA